MPRTISHRGAEAVQYSTRLLGAAVCIALTALLVLLGRIVLTPLARVTDHAQRIAAADDLSARLAYDRRDELGTLARAFDNMVERLARSRRELIDRSFESGAAENASGILHNLGNAMTPMSVNIAGLQQQLEAVPFEDLQQALEELRNETPDDARRADLQQFVLLAATEFVHTLQRGKAKLHGIVEQIQVMQAVLAEQRRHQRSEPLRQSMTPAELVARGLQQIAPEHLERLDVDVIARARRPGRIFIAVHYAGHGAAESCAECRRVRGPGRHGPHAAAVRSRACRGKRSACAAHFGH